jgi:RsiG-like
LTLYAPACFTRRNARAIERKGCVDVFPDLTTLSDDDLHHLISELEAEEDDLSYKRRLLHGKIDMLRAERTARRKGKGEKALAEDVDVEKLSEILSGKATPPPAA